MGRMTKLSRARKSRGAPALSASVAQLRALAHPLRLRLVELFAEAPRTTMKVAKLLGQPPTRLYHHVNALEHAGILRVRESRKNRGTTERWYEVTTPLYYAKSRAELAGSPGVPESLSVAVASMIDHTRREVTAALTDPKPKSVIAVRVLSIGTPKQITAIRRSLRAFLKQLAKRGSRRIAHRSNAPLERWAATITFAPVWPRGPEP
jgi:DNA-binding transcriptional ArsR family regulator